MDFLLAATDAKQKYKAYMKDWRIHDQAFIEKAFQYNQSELLVSFDQLVSQLMFKESNTLTYVDKMAVIQIDDRYIVQPVYVKTMHEDLRLLIERIRIAFQKLPLISLPNSVALYRFYQQLVQQLFTKKEARLLIRQTTEPLLKTRLKTLPLKQIHLLYIVYLFTQKDRQTGHYISAYRKKWTTGKWATTEKEEVLLTYINMHMAAWKQSWQKVLRLGTKLLQEDRLANQAVELIVDYGKMMPSYNSDSSQLVKSFKAHFMQYTWFLLVEALDAIGDYEGIIYLLNDEPHASCDAFVACLHNEDETMLANLETNIQQSIAYYMDGHCDYIEQALAQWEQLRLARDVQLEEVVEALSAHLCRVMKALHYTGKELLLRVLWLNYQRYFYVDEHAELINNMLYLADSERREVAIGEE